MKAYGCLLLFEIRLLIHSYMISFRLCFVTLLFLPFLHCSWNEWLKLPVKYPDLPQSAQVALTVWDVYGPGRATPVGGTTVTLFGKYG